MEKKIPVRKLVIAKDTQGISSIAFVDEPAIMIDFVKFNKEVPIKYAYDEGRNIIFSPVLIPDQQIYRVDPKTKEEYMVYMDRETVMQAAIKWQMEGRYNLANEMHDPKAEVPQGGITWFNPVFTDEQMFSAPKGFEGLPWGTFFIAGYVKDTELKQKIANQTYRGISMEGIFSQIEEAYSLTDEQISAINESFL